MVSDAAIATQLLRGPTGIKTHNVCDLRVFNKRQFTQNFKLQFMPWLCAVQHEMQNGTVRLARCRAYSFRSTDINRSLSLEDSETEHPTNCRVDGLVKQKIFSTFISVFHFSSVVLTNQNTFLQISATEEINNTLSFDC